MADSPLDDLVARTEVAMRSAPPIASSPGVVYGAASSDDPYAAGAGASFTQGYQQLGRLQSLDPVRQVSTWNSMTPQQQNLIGAMGYKPPRLHHQPWWQVALKDVGAVLATAGAAALGTAIGGPIAGFTAATLVGGRVLPGVSKALEPLGAPLRGVQHVFRAAAVTDREQGWVGSLGSMFSPSAWHHAWRVSTDGDRYHPGADQAALATGLPAAYVPIAIDTVERAPSDYLEGKYGLDAVQAAQSDPAWQQALAAADSKKVSFGRVIANLLTPLGMKPGVAETLIPRVGAFPGVHLTTYNYLSGALDGLYDWYADPLQYAQPGTLGAIAQAPKTALEEGLLATRKAAHLRFSIKGADDVQRIYDRYASVRFAHSQFIKAFNEGGAGAVQSLFPKLGPIAFDIADQGVEALTNESLLDHLKGYAGLTATAQGEAPRYMVAYNEAMRLTPPTWAIKKGLLKASDVMDSWRGLKDADRVPGLNRLAHYTAQFANLYRRIPSFDAYDPNTSSQVIRQVAELALPRSEVERTVSSFASGDLGTRYRIYRSLVSDVFHTMGSDWRGDAPPQTPMGIYHRDFLGELDGEIGGHGYSIDDTGRITSNIQTLAGGSYAAGVYESQMTQGWAVPDARRIGQAQYAASRMAKLTTLGGHVPPGLVSSWLMPLWKGTHLARIGFGMRVGGEEALLMILRDGFTPYLKSVLASGTIKNESALGALGFKIEGARVIPSGLGVSAELQAKLGWQSTLAQYGMRFGKGIRAALAGEQYLQAARELMDTYGEHMAPAGVTANGRYHQDNPEALVKSITDTWYGTPRPTIMSRTGQTEQIFETDPRMSEAWAQMLKSRAQPVNKSFAIAVRNIHDLAIAEQEVHNYLASDEAASLRARAARSVATPDRRTVGAFEPAEGALAQVGTATGEEALRSWAHIIVQDTKALVAPRGTPLPQIIDSLVAGEVPDATTLASIPREQWPTMVLGERLVPTSAGWLRYALNGFFEKVADPMVNAISRRPQFIHEYAIRRAELEAEHLRLSNIVGTKNADAIVKERSAWDAQGKLLPNIHDPQLRSQYEQFHPTLMPFWFAQRQFIQRWGRALLKDPALYRRAQLTMDGLRHMGAVTKDDKGDDVFVYPGFGVIQELASSLPGRLILGLGGPMLPIPIAPTAKVKYLTPGLERLAVPSVGPFVATALNVGRRLWPEFGRVETAVVGERGAGQPIWKNYVPSVASNLYEAVLGSPDKDAQLSSAIMQAMTYMEHAGLTPKEDSTPGEQEAYIARVRKWARVIIGMRALIGFSTPAAPSLEFTGNLNREYRDLMSKMPIAEATAEFMARHPDADAFTVFQTTTPAGAVKPIPPTQAAGDFIATHSGFVGHYKQASTWFFPDAPQGFDATAWREEMALGLRTRRTPEGMFEALKTSSDGDIYFPSQKAYLQARQGTTGQARREIDQSWFAWKNDFLSTRPLFALKLQEGGQRDAEREQGISMLGQALADPKAPDAGHNEAMRTLVESYRQWQSAMMSLQGLHDISSQTQRQALSQSFYQWASAQSDPQAQRVFDQLMSQKVENSLSQAFLAQVVA